MLPLLDAASETRALILAPHGRDAAVATSLLRAAGVTSAAYPDIAAFQAALDDSACLAVVTEETLRTADLRGIGSWIEAQPSWSDLPFIVLTQRGGGPERNPGAARLSGIFGNVTFLERPFHPTTFVSVARTAHRGRLRQYDARRRLIDLHESEARLHTALMAGRLGSWEYTLASGRLVASATCKAVFGRAPDDPFGYDALVASIHHDDRARMQAAVRESFETGVDYAIVYRNIWPDGSLHWAEINARVVRNGRGEPSGMVGVSSDITDRKTVEEGLLRLNETLEERIAARTRELEQAHAAVIDEMAQRERAEDQLRQAQKMEMIGQLTGGVAHDFNNLLMAVLGSLELLRKHAATDGRATRLIDAAMQGARRGAALTQRLLAFARRQDLHVEPRNLADLIRGMTDLLERSVGPHISLQMRLRDALPLALVDGNQIELALLNLVVNARDAMPEGGLVLVELDEMPADGSGDLAPGRYLRLTVSDSGVGMDPETLLRATEPFFSTKGLGKGTGLGLSMIQGLAMQLNGSLRLASTVGTGTRAELWVPVSDTTEEGHPSAETPAVPVSLPASLTILVVDDDPLIAMSTVDMLEDLGHEVLAAHSGSSALGILQNGTAVDLLVTDYAMPRMTGAQLATAVRKIQPDLPILLVTGYAELPSGSVMDLPRLGKPFQQNQLAAMIGQLTRKERPLAADDRAH